MFDIRENSTVEGLIKLNQEAKTQLSLLDEVNFDCFCKAN